MQEEISLRELFELLKKHMLKLIIAMVVGLLVALTWMFVLVKPQYSSETQLLVNQQQQLAPQAIQYNEIQSNIQLINTYRDIITGQSVLEQVNKNIEGNYSTAELKRAITISQSPNSQAFFIRVIMDTPEEAQQVVTELLKAFEQTLKEAYGKKETSIYVVSPPSFNPNKVSPSASRYALIGAFAGLLIIGIVILLIEGMDNTIRTEEFVIQLGLVNLGSIQCFSEEDVQQSRLNSKGRRVNRRRR